MTKERNILVYHHNDLDGYGAAGCNMTQEQFNEVFIPVE